jgi:hypothetical protein
MTDSKTKTLGTLDAAKAKKIVGWDNYLKAAQASTEARRVATEAKAKVKDAMAKTLKEEAATLDFTVETSGTVRIFKNLVEKKPRPTDVADLSDKF